MLQIQKFTFNPFQENTYVIYDEVSKEAVIVDPGCYHQHEEETLTNFIESENLDVILLLNTHCHIDHVLGNQFVIEKYKVNLLIHEADLQGLNAVQNYAHLYGMPGYKISPQPYGFLDEGDQLTIGENIVDVIFVPGHAPGHIAFISNEDKWIINGDCVFAGSIGRTDLPGGDYETLEKSIKEKIYSLPDDFTIYSGHGPETSVGHEKIYNQFVKG